MKVLHNSPALFQKKVLRIAGREQAQAFTFSPPFSPMLSSIENIHKTLCYELSGHDYILVGEFDDNLRWHYHGVTVGVPIHQFADRLKHVGFCKFDGQPSIKWLEYMFKDILNTMKTLDTPAYPVYTPNDFKVRASITFVLPEERNDVEAEPHPLGEAED